MLDHMLDHTTTPHVHRVYGVALMRGEDFVTLGDFWTVLTHESAQALVTIPQDSYFSSGVWHGHYEESECFLQIRHWIHKNSIYKLQ